MQSKAPQNVQSSDMEVVFADGYIPAGLRVDFLRRCAEFRAASHPGTVWVRCLLEMLYMASTNLHPAHILTADLVRACRATEETLQVGLAPGKVAEAIRGPAVGVVGKICAWHHGRPELVEWMLQTLKTCALLPAGRMPVDTARRLCERAVTFQGVLRPDADADALGRLLVRVVGLGSRGATTLRKLWHDRSDHLGYAIRYRAWALLAGLAENSAGPAGPHPRVAVQFDCNLWECAAAEAQNQQRNTVLKQLLRHFRSAKMRGVIQCNPFKCLAATTVDAAMLAPDYNPVLVAGAKLFLTEEHAIKGCMCSAWRGFRDASSRDEYGLPGWGGDGSSCAATVARRCVELNTKRNKASGNGQTVTRAMLEVLTPMLAAALEPKKPAAMNLYEGTIAQHTRQAIGVLAAAPFLDNGSEPERLRLLHALKGRAVAWRRCVARLPACGERVVSRLHAWEGPKPVQNLVEATSAAGAFQCDNNLSFDFALRSTNLYQSSPEALRVWAMTTVLGMFAAPCLGEAVAKVHRRSQSVEHQQSVLEIMVALENALEHPEFSALALKGRFTGSWRCKSWRFDAGASRLIKFFERTGAAYTVKLLKREAGLWIVKPCDRFKGWWHLGRAFSDAARCFLAVTVYGYPATKLPQPNRLPPELAIKILAAAASLPRG